MTSFSSFYHYSDGECPICNGSSGCGQSHSTGFIHCFNSSEANANDSGYKFICESEIGCGVFVEDDQYEEWLEENTGIYIEDQHNRTPESFDKSKLWENWDHFSLNRQITASRNLFDSLPLKEEHQADLLERQLTEEQIEEIGFSSLDSYRTKGVDFHSLPGFSKFGDQYRYHGISGYAIPCFDPKGRKVSYQLKADNVLDGKYRWNKTQGLASSRIRFRGSLEFPLTAVTCDPAGLKADTLYLCEGILKPIIAAHKHNINVIGAFSGFFHLSPNQLKHYLKEYNYKRIVFLPDSATSANVRVLKNLNKVSKLIGELTHSPLYYLDWGQLFDKAKLDCDEVDSFSLELCHPIEIDKIPYDISLDKREIIKNSLQITSKVMEEIPEEWKRTRKKQKPSTYKKYEGSLLTPSYPSSALTFKENQFIQILNNAKQNGYKIILLSSATGAGKSHTVGNFSPYQFNSSAIHYLSKQHRYPSTESLERNYSTFPSKNGQLYIDPNKRTPLGHPVLIRDKPIPFAGSVQGNCSQFDRQLALYQLNVNASSCKMCPMYNKCTKGEQPGEYGYLYQSALAYEQERLRVNPQSLDPERIPEGAIAFIDEYNQTLDFTTAIEISRFDWAKEEPNLRRFLGIHYDKLSPLISYLNKEKNLGRYGMSAANYFDEFGQLRFLNHLASDAQSWEEKNTEEAMEFGDTPDKVWISDVFRALSGEDPNISFRLENNKLHIVKRNERLQEVLSSYDLAVYMDATGTRQQLAMQLGVTEQEILEIKHETIEPTNTTVLQVSSLGNLGKQRDVSLRKRVKALRTALIKQYGRNDVGFVEWKKWAEDEDLIHFVDARGSNNFKSKKAVVSLGVANVNLGAARVEFEVLSGSIVKDRDQEFSDYYRHLSKSEIVQEIGRLRSIRRMEESLVYYLVSNQDAKFLSELGFNYQQISGCEIAPEVGRPEERLVWAVKHLVSIFDRKEITQKDLAVYLEKSVSSISNLVKRKGYNGWVDFKESIFKQLDADPILLAHTLVRLPILQFNYIIAQVNQLQISSIYQEQNNQFLTERMVI